jgi:hypothetical protein
MASRWAIPEAQVSARSPRAGRGPADGLRIGWVERVSLPDLGLLRVAAKVDTGARTSALHVTAVEHPAPDGEVHPTSRRFLYAVLPPGRHGEKRVVRLAVTDWVEVRDTSGRLERRPVIVTTLELGPFRRTIRLSLTDRGDMRYPLLVGRTALFPGVLVDPAARFLLRQRPRRSKGKPKREKI